MSKNLTNFNDLIFSTLKASMLKILNRENDLPFVEKLREIFLSVDKSNQEIKEILKSLPSENEIQANAYQIIDDIYKSKDINVLKEYLLKFKDVPEAIQQNNYIPQFTENLANELNELISNIELTRIFSIYNFFIDDLEIVLKRVGADEAIEDIDYFDLHYLFNKSLDSKLENVLSDVEIEAPFKALIEQNYNKILKIDDWNQKQKFFNKVTNTFAKHFLDKMTKELEEMYMNFDDEFITKFATTNKLTDLQFYIEFISELLENFQKLH
ncbi:hypothetical protein [Mycoplasma putrefaciens]|uniref:Uncharacterized protein n=1 Tax=Mycoplasma putrefaciens Mput9231 TaxID=1292033 RepID=M9WH14_9MOLU|nr:hypothetical protein [Mycoplasma putrefaciens]AGJ90745.1 Hypothetical protein MPUT9231_3240 [Mycoplasma putrefaciens Mput9231]